MIPVDVGPELQNVIKLGYLSQRPILLKGTTGVGKSESLDEAAKALGIQFIVRDLSLMEGPDLAGLPIIKGNHTRFATPAFLPKEGKGLLVFEELNRAPRYTRAPCLQLLTTRHLNDYRLPDGWLPVGAINPAGGDYTDVDELDTALLARFIQIDVRPSSKNWLTWAEKHDVHVAVREFVRATPKIFDTTDSNPRAWKYVSDVLHQYEEHKFGKETLLPVLAGLVGEKMAHAFWGFYANFAGAVMPKAETVILKYSSVRETIKTWVRAGNTSNLESLCQQVMLYLQDPAVEEEVLKDERATKNLGRLVQDLPPEFVKKLKGNLSQDLLRRL